MTSSPTFLVREYSIVLFSINFHITVLRSGYEIKYRCIHVLHLYTFRQCMYNAALRMETFAYKEKYLDFL